MSVVKTICISVWFWIWFKNLAKVIWLYTSVRTIIQSCGFILTLSRDEKNLACEYIPGIKALRNLFDLLQYWKNYSSLLAMERSTHICRIELSISWIFLTKLITARPDSLVQWFSKTYIKETKEKFPFGLVFEKLKSFFTVLPNTIMLHR